jgi:hypothetical protein
MGGSGHLADVRDRITGVSLRIVIGNDRRTCAGEHLTEASGHPTNGRGEVIKGDGQLTAVGGRITDAAATPSPAVEARRLKEEIRSVEVET